jgi:hypothetical protein
LNNPIKLADSVNAAQALSPLLRFAAALAGIAFRARPRKALRAGPRRAGLPGALRRL